MNERKASRLRRCARCLSIAACLAGVIACTAWLAGEQASAQYSRRLADSLGDLYAVGTDAETPASTEAPVPIADAPLPRETPLPIQEDFRALYSANRHLVGWLEAGESIDLPVVQFDNEFYLTHDFYGRDSADGTLFVNEANQIWPPDDVIIIHGHNMRSGAQFGTLRRFESYRYARRHPLVTFRTIRDREDVRYVVVAAFNASMFEGNPEYFDIARLRFHDGPAEAGKREMEAYLAAIDNLSLWHGPVKANADDRLLMLVTCSYYQDDGRFVLVCRRLRKGETPEAVEALFAG